MAEYIDRATALEALKNAAEYYSRVDDCTEWHVACNLAFLIEMERGEAYDK